MERTGTTQLGFEQQTLGETKQQFQAAILLWDKAATDDERRIAAEEMNRTRGILILEYGFSLEGICELVDEARA